MRYVMVGLSHKTAPVEIREKLAIVPSKVGGMLARLTESEDVQEAMLISTCNRVEAYLVAKHLERGVRHARKLLADWGRFPENELDPYLYVKGEDAAIGHLFRVAASLDSMVLGEPQISGQVKEAYTQAVAAGTTGTYLNRLVHRSLHVAKRIRHETAIGQCPVSISYAAVLLATRIFDNLKEKKVLVIGAGEMGELVCRHLKERGVAKILIANRTLEKAATLAREFEGDVVNFNQLETLLAESDIVIASIEAEGPLIGVSLVQEAMGRRKGRAMFLVDLGVPRNIDPETNRIENLYLYDIDDLEGIVEANLKEREKEGRRAEGIIDEEVGKFLKSLKEMDLAPTIRQLSKKFDLIRRRELARYLGRRPEVAGEEKEELEALTNGIVNKILHDPIILMKTEEAQDGQPKYSEILKKLFRLE